jgi:cation:H+ antiporter
LEISAPVAVLPEYAVDFVFAWRGGNAVQADGPARTATRTPVRSLALANMTGANRLLIGIGWALVVLPAFIRRRRGRPGGGSGYRSRGRSK